MADEVIGAPSLMTKAAAECSMEARRLDGKVGQLVINSAQVARRPSKESYTKLATRTEETITSVYALIHQMRKLRDEARREAKLHP